MAESNPTDRTRLRQLPARGHYDRETIYAIVDEALVAHVGFEDGGQVFVMPMTYGRLGDRLILHGAQKARFARVARSGASFCVTVTLLDGLILAKSALHHSMNYRSVVAIGSAQEIIEEEEKTATLRAVVEHVVRGRWAETRQPNDAELKATAVFGMPLNDASATIRSGPPVDAKADLDLAHWAGENPLALTPQTPITADYVPEPKTLPLHVRDYRR